MTPSLDSLPDGALMSDVEAAPFLGITHGTLRNWRLNGRGPKFVRIGSKRILYKVADLRSFLKVAA